MNTQKTYSNEVKQAAEKARKTLSKNIGKQGLILLWEGKHVGWRDELRDPQTERPGVIAVDPEGNVYEAQGGNDQNGATSWVSLKS